MNLNPKQFQQQAWYHGGNPRFLDAPNYVHVGTRQAAEQRIDPNAWDPEDETFYDMKRNSGLYEVRLARGARVAPEVATDDEFSDKLLFTPTAAAARKKARPDWYAGTGEFDAYPYTNDFEDEGKVSLYANPEKLLMVRRLR